MQPTALWRSGWLRVSHERRFQATARLEGLKNTLANTRDKGQGTAQLEVAGTREQQVWTWVFSVHDFRG